jgi:GNAT superfamily N-acetyltransferase
MSTEESQPAIAIEERPPTTAELRALAEAVGWTDHYDWDTIGGALVNSLYGVVALDGTRVVGCARLVGDGVRYFYVQDVLVDPVREGDGIATTLVETLLEWIRATAPAEAFVGLFSSPDARGVYEGVGFAAPDDMTGMARTTAT